MPIIWSADGALRQQQPLTARSRPGTERCGSSVSYHRSCIIDQQVHVSSLNVSVHQSLEAPCATTGTPARCNPTDSPAVPGGQHAVAGGMRPPCALGRCVGSFSAALEASSAAETGDEDCARADELLRPSDQMFVLTWWSKWADWRHAHGLPAHIDSRNWTSANKSKWGCRTLLRTASRITVAVARVACNASGPRGRKPQCRVYPKNQISDREGMGELWRRGDPRGCLRQALARTGEAVGNKATRRVASSKRGVTAS